MIATLRAIALRLRTALTRHAAATAASAVLAAGVAGLAGGYAIAGHQASASTAPAAPVTVNPTPGTGAAGSGTAGHRGQAGAVAAALVEITATQTGQSRAGVVAALQSGRSLDDIAAGQASAVAAAAMARLKARLDAQVSSGKMTADAENRRLAQLQQQLGKLMAEPGTVLAQQLGQAGGESAPATPTP